MKRSQHAGRARSGGFSLNVFTPDEIDDIHLATLEVLERTGVFVEDDEPLDIFSDGGCRVDREHAHGAHSRRTWSSESLARLPAHHHLLRPHPRPRLHGRSRRRVHLHQLRRGHQVHRPLHAASTATRPSRTSPTSPAWSTPWPTSTATSRPSAPPTCPPRPTRCTASRRPCSTPPSAVGCEAINKWEARKCIELAAIVAGGEDELRERPFLGLGVCPVSPLKLPRDATEVIIECSRAGLPDTILSMAMSGGSAPVTLAGTLVQHNAEVLSGIVLAQLTERGSPVIYGSSTTAMDLRFAAGVGRLARARPDRRGGGPARQAVPPAELHRRCVGRLQAR